MATLTKDEIAEKLVGQITQLPPMPANVLKLREQARDPNANYNTLAPLIKQDPSITADVLRLANSAQFGVGHKVETIDEAIRYFGINPLINFISAACSDKIVKQVFTSITNLNTYLTHSLEISLATSVVSKMMRMNSHQRDVIAITGLLHDIGRLVILLVTNKKNYNKEILGVSWEEVQDYVKDEKELYGLDHAELGGMISKKWDFPDTMTEAIARHHSPIVKGKTSFGGLVLFISEVIAIDNLPDNVLEKALPTDILEKYQLVGEDLVKAREAFQKLREES